MEINVHAGAGKLQQVIEIGRHTLLADEPVAIGGEDTGPAPYDLLAASLGACTALTVTMYARHKNYPLQDVRVRVEHAQQAEAYVFTRHITYVGELDEEQRTRLTAIANKCPIHKVLSGAIQIVTHAA
jgi:putative redox protein